MSLPAQLFIQLQKGEEIIHCPSCQRILYFQPIPESEAG